MTRPRPDPHLGTPAAKPALPHGKMRMMLPTLGGMLQRANITLALGAVIVVGLMIGLPSLITVRFYAKHDLQLLSRALADTVEAATVFGDAEATEQAMKAIITDEDVAAATVITSDGRVLARFRADDTRWKARIAGAVSRMLMLEPAVHMVMHEGAVVGRVTVVGGGLRLMQFMGVGAAGVILGQAMIAALALYLSRRVMRRIVKPLRTLADMTGTVQRERQFDRRVPRAGIAELDELGHSFNALLAELDAWQSRLEGENRRLTHQATHDGLTGLANRAFFEGRLNRALMSARQADSTLAVMLIDCDKFKAINDTHGHAAGDLVLTSIASRLKGQCRETDLVARLGGDEFAILIVPGPNATGLRIMADAIGTAMQIPLQVRQGVSVLTSLSVGVASYPADAEDATGLLRHADERMYKAKGLREGSLREGARGLHTGIGGRNDT